MPFCWCAAAPKSALDVLLEEIETLIDTFLPIIAPLLGLTDEQVQQVIDLVDKFVVDTEAVEHGTVDVTDGLVAMMDDILEILKALGIDWTAPSKWYSNNNYRNSVSYFGFGFGLVRIRPLRSDLTISEPWDEGNGFE